MKAEYKKTLDNWLDEVNYHELNSGIYVPGNFALTFMNFIKLVNGAEGESNKTPPVHLKMLDKIETRKSNYIVNVLFRGAAKTTVFMEYLSLYLGVFNYLPSLGEVYGMLYVSDSMENGVKKARKNIEFRYNSSSFLREWIPVAKFTDSYIEFTNKEGRKIGISLYGAKALSLDEVIYLSSGQVTTIGSCSIGDEIIGANGKPTIILDKSEVFYRPMYELVFDDGRRLKVCEDHLNQVHIKKFLSNRTFSKYSYTECTLSTKELLELDLHVIDPSGSKRPLVWVENIKPMEFPTNTNQLIDPYAVGVLLGDGSLHTKGNGSTPVVLTSHVDDWPTYLKEIPYEFGKEYVDKRNPNTVSRTVLGINHLIPLHNLNSHGDFKHIPEVYLFGSVEQRLALLQGLMDTDGACTDEGKSSFSSNSKVLVEGVMWLVRSLGGEARWINTGKEKHFKAFVRLNMPMFRLERKLKRQKPPRLNLHAIVEINKINDEPSQCIMVDSEDHQFVVGEGLIRTHNTGIRGVKMFGKRPVICVLDDLISDEDSKSVVSMQAINDTIYKGVNHALDPNKRLIIFNGTPFHKGDVIVEAVESGKWDVNVWPVCEKFPCDKKDFRGAWEERFSYEYLKEQHGLNKKAFFQELMLRISGDDERLVLDEDINWYSKKVLLNNTGSFNFYITTDFATSAKETADFSVISVWAYNNNGDWFWVDGMCEKQTMDKNIDALFNFTAYNPQSVGIETDGQQGGFVSWIKKEMLNRNIFFNLASSEKTGEGGIRSRKYGDKFSRFNLAVPLFKAGKIFFPEEMKNSKIIKEFMEQISLATEHGFRGKDDCLDTISMLNFLNAWRPSASVSLTPQSSSGIIIDMEEDRTMDNAMRSYIV